MQRDATQSAVIALPQETGHLGIRHLKRFWSEQLARARGLIPEFEGDWVADNTLLCGLRLGLRETYDYIFQKAPSFEEFESWVLEKNGGSISPALIKRLNAALSEDGIAGQPADPESEPALTASD